MNTVDEPYGELASSFAGIARTLFSAPTVLATLPQIVDFAFATVEGSGVACISLLAEDNVFTPAYSAPLALEIDELQYAAREGPCLDAIWPPGSNVAGTYAKPLGRSSARFR